MEPEAVWRCMNRTKKAVRPIITKYHDGRLKGKSVERLVFLVSDLVRADGEEDNRLFRKVEITVLARLFLIGE